MAGQVVRSAEMRRIQLPRVRKAAQLCVAAAGQRCDPDRKELSNWYVRRYYSSNQAPRVPRVACGLRTTAVLVVLLV